MRRRPEEWSQCSLTGWSCPHFCVTSLAYNKSRSNHAARRRHEWSGALHDVPRRSVRCCLWYPPFSFTKDIVDRSIVNHPTSWRGVFTTGDQESRVGIMLLKFDHRAMISLGELPHPLVIDFAG